MKAYVIKNEMFYARGTTQWVDELPFASIFNKKEDAEKLKNEIKEEFDDCNPQVVTLTICEGDLEEENRQLKQQLAEKTLTIEQINKAFIENRSLWKGKYEQSNQDKISFAVEQLEKVKELLLEKCGETYSKTYCGIDEDIEEIISKQINELKEIMKDEMSNM